jgi:hypothetical protein
MSAHPMQLSDSRSGPSRAQIIRVENVGIEASLF